MKEQEDYSHGHRLLTVVERIVDSPDSIVNMVRSHQRRAGVSGSTMTESQRRAVAETLIAHFSNRTALSGGAAALPAMFPGLGTIASLTGGALADMGLMLKFEVELALALTQLFGFDITQERERQIAFLLASVSTYDAKSGRNFFIDAAAAEGVAIWNYAPRQLSKLLLSVLTRIALLNISKGLLRALPLVGVAVGASVNKVLTRRVGTKCCEALEQRLSMGEGGKKVPDDDEVDARVSK